MYSKISIVILCIFSGSLMAQTKLSGTIKKADGQPVEYANVLVYQIIKTDTLLKKYTIANDKGQYSTVVPLADTIFIRARAMGYADGLLKLHAHKADAVHDFVLYPKVIQLYEVVVKSPPIIIGGDTTIFVAKHFRDSTEQNVEELIAKLPGMSVNQSGKISYKGKNIETVMVEGTEMFGQNYQLLTRSLTPLALDKIEVIENYSSNKLLRGIEKNNKAAINLTIRKELKIRPFGNASIGIGYKDRYNLSGTVLSLVSKLKVGIVGNTNNIGYKPIDEEEYSMNDDMQLVGNQLIYTNRSNLLSTNRLASVYGAEVNTKRVTFNTARQLGITAALTINPKIKLHAYSYIYRDQMKFYAQQKTQYFSEKNSLIVLDSSFQSQSPLMRFSQFLFNYEINTKTNMSYELNLKNSEITSDNYYYTQNQKLTEGVPTNGIDKVIGQTHNVGITRKLNDTTVIFFTTKFTALGLNRLNNAQSVRYNRSLWSSTGPDIMSQAIDEEQRRLKTNMKIYSKNKLGRYEMNVGNSISGDDVLTTIFLKNQQKETTLNDDFRNDFVFKNNVFYADFSQRFSIKRISFNIDASIQNISSRLYNELTKQNTFNENRTLFQPLLSMNKITKYGDFSFSLKRNQKMPEIQNLTDGYIQHSYRSFTANQPFFVMGKSNSYSFGYRYSSSHKFYNANITLSWQQNRVSMASEAKFDEYLSFTTYRPQETTMNQYSINYFAEKLLTKLSTKIILMGSASQSEMLNRVNGGSLTPTYSQYINSRVYLISAFDGPFNFQFLTNFSTNRFVNGITNTKTTGVKVIQPEITLRYNPKKNLSLFMIGEQVNWFRSNSQRDVVTLCDFKGVYIPKKAKSLNLTLTINNLLNNKAVYNTQVSFYSMTQNVVRLQPRYVLLTVSRAF